MFSRVANDETQTKKALKARQMAGQVAQQVSLVIQQHKKAKKQEIQSEINKLQDTRLSQMQAEHLEKGGDPADLPVLLPDDEKQAIQSKKQELESKQRIHSAIGLAMGTWKVMNTVSMVKRIVGGKKK